jgi:hypothetical protein
MVNSPYQKEPKGNNNMSNKFDLLKDKPELDIPTLNYVWDMLWRRNAANSRKNTEQRIRCNEREYIMKMIETAE